MLYDYKPKKYLLIEYPYSKKVINHQEAKLLDPFEDNFNERSCIIPEEIWNKYKNTVYGYIEEKSERELVIERDNLLD
jgi:hypothetical protein